MNHKIVLNPLEPNDVVEASECLAKGFLREPMTESLKISYEEMLGFCQPVVSKASKLGLSVIAKDIETDKIVGLTINKDFLNSPTEENVTLNKKLFPIFKLLDDLDKKYQQSNEVDVNEVFHTLMIAVNSDIKTRNLSSKLLSRSLENAVNNGFKKTVMEATSSISQHIALNKFSYKEFHSINYSDFSYKNKNTFRHINSVSSCKLLYKELN